MLYFFDWVGDRLVFPTTPSMLLPFWKKLPKPHDVINWSECLLPILQRGGFLWAWVVPFSGFPFAGQNLPSFRACPCVVFSFSLSRSRILSLSVSISNWNCSCNLSISSRCASIASSRALWIWAIWLVRLCNRSAFHSPNCDFSAPCRAISLSAVRFVDLSFTLWRVSALPFNFLPPFPLTGCKTGLWSSSASCPGHVIYRAWWESSCRYHYGGVTTPNNAYALWCSMYKLSVPAKSCARLSQWTNTSPPSNSWWRVVITHPPIT